MPTLDWENKSAAIRAAKKIPYRLLDFDSDSSCGDDDNLIVQGDNLLALKSLLPFYRQRVKCVYIDPPYNTHSAFEHYDDNFEHAQWLSMMYPRLELLREFLSDDGAIFISIDDTEAHYLKVICDEIFGRNNFVAQCSVKRLGGRQDSKFFAVVNEYLICYAKSTNFFIAGEEVKADEVYPKFDAERGRNYKTQLLRKWGSNSRRIDRPNLFYPIPAPDGTELYPMLSATAEGRWRWGKNKMQQALDDGLIEFVAKDGAWVAYEKIFAPLDGESRTKKFTTWIDDSSTGASELKKIFGKQVFDYPKAVELIERVLKMGNVDKNSLVLDAFAGSGTTAHAVINLNATDGGARKFILIEQQDYCKTITAERVKRVGGSYKFYRLGAEIFDAVGAINPAVSFEQLAAYIWFKFTGKAYVAEKKSPLIGIHDGTAYYLLYNGILGDNRDEGGNVLTKKILATLPEHDGEKIIFGEACRISAENLKLQRVKFLQTPTEIQ